MFLVYERSVTFLYLFFSKFLWQENAEIAARQYLEKAFIIVFIAGTKRKLKLAGLSQA